MKLPNSGNAIIPESKITDYLLDLEHPIGRGKAIFFLRCGFNLMEWWGLADALKAHALTAEITKHEKTEFGQRYILEGVMETPSGRTPQIRSVWIVLHGTSNPQLVSAYPIGR